MAENTREVIYEGPGDSVEIDGKTIKRGEVVKLTPEQVSRLRASDAEAKVSDAPKTTTKGA